MLDSIIEDFPKFESLIVGLNSSMIREFEIYYHESKFGLILILEDLVKISKDEEIFEIGSGIGLLSYFLASKGFSVTAIEPVGPGFGIMNNLQKHIQSFFAQKNMKIRIHKNSIENFLPEFKYKYVFAINVFEHLSDPKVGLLKTEMLLSEGGFARIISPNYALPYEPHFNIPIIFNKTLTYVGFRTHIRSFDCYEPMGLWASLNWISISKMRRFLRKQGIKSSFSFRATSAYFQRLNGDDLFARRKGPFFKLIANLLKNISRLLPSRLFPIIDLTIMK